MIARLNAQNLNQRKFALKNHATQRRLRQRLLHYSSGLTRLFLFAEGSVTWS